MNINLLCSSCAALAFSGAIRWCFTNVLNSSEPSYIFSNLNMVDFSNLVVAMYMIGLWSEFVFGKAFCIEFVRSGFHLGDIKNRSSFAMISIYLVLVHVKRLPYNLKLISPKSEMRLANTRGRLQFALCVFRSSIEIFALKSSHKIYGVPSVSAIFRNF